MSTVQARTVRTSLADLSPWDSRRSYGHSVQFYEEESSLLEGLIQFIGAAVLAGDSALVIAKKSHREGLTELLNRRGFDLTRATNEGRFLSLDAAEILEKFVVQGDLDATRFGQVVGDLIDGLAAAGDGGDRRVAVYGDMVALLFSDGQPEGAIRLEQLWNQLAETHTFQLHCAYPLNQFSLERHGKALLEICAEHSHIVPTERYTRLVDEQERLSTIVSLQQKAQVLETEIQERKRVQRDLEDRETELRDFLENAVIGMHRVAWDGTILWANKAELSLLGYERNEYVGRHISEFHADSAVIDDILQRLNRREELSNYEARLRCKDGSLRYVRIDSNALFRDGQFIHTRCFTMDITDKKESESALSRLAAIVESSDDAIVSKDLNGIIRSWNNGAERILGYTAEEVIGRPVTLLIPIELLDEENVVLSKIKAGERIDHFETVRLTKDGRRIDVSLTISPVKDGRGKIVGAAKILRDITEHRKASISRNQLAAIVDSSEDAIISKDLNGIVTGWNQSAERIFGYKPQEIIGRPITLIIPSQFLNDEALILSKVRAGERLDHFQTVRLNKSGGLVDVSLTVSPVKDGSGKIVGAAKIIRDITQQKKMEATFHTSERLASVGRLAATVAHEINNPLEAVVNFIYLAKQDPALPESIRAYLNAADKEIGRVAHITQQTLGFYRDNSQPVTLVIEDVIQDVLTIYERKCQYKALKIERRIEPGLMLSTLRGELKQILSNLIANAIDASKEDGKILIRAKTSRHFPSGRLGVRITVADNGAGISDQDKEKLFAPFFTTKASVGTGLGLWITKDLLKKKGGHIQFCSNSSDRSGTVMRIFLPLAT
jgi:PAS domain S-box-containing protein